jgi:ABC-2 type transport system permease protein
MSGTTAMTPALGPRPMPGTREVRGTMALSRLEMMRVLRNKQYLIFTLAFPLVFYLAVGKQAPGTKFYGVPFAAYYMVAMATWSALSGALNGNAQRISQERKDGWIRQLRLTSLPASSYVVAKVIASMVTTVPSIVIVLALGHFYGGVYMAAWKWVVIGAAAWLGAMTFAALAVAIGYKFLPDRAQPLALLVYFGMSILGGLWFPLSGVLQAIGKALPTYQVTRIGTGVLAGGTVPVTAVAVILAWLAGFVVLAALAVRSTAEKV